MHPPYRLTVSFHRDPMDFVASFIGELRQRAEDRQSEGSPAAAVYARVADELETRMRAWELEEVTLREAHAITGFSESQLRRLLADGKTTLRRGDLPRKPGHGVRRAPRLTGASPSLAEDILTGQTQARTRRRHA